MTVLRSRILLVCAIVSLMGRAPVAVAFVIESSTGPDCSDPLPVTLSLADLPFRRSKSY